MQTISSSGVTDKMHLNTFRGVFPLQNKSDSDLMQFRRPRFPPRTFGSLFKTRGLIKMRNYAAPLRPPSFPSAALFLGPAVWWSSKLPGTVSDARWKGPLYVAAAVWWINRPKRKGKCWENTERWIWEDKKPQLKDIFFKIGLLQIASHFDYIFNAAQTYN